MRFFSRRLFSNDEKQQREMITKKFLKKLERRIFFFNTKWLLENEIWTTIFVGKAIFVVNFLRSSENSIVFEKEGLPKKKKRKTMKDFFWDTSNNRNSENKFLEEWNKWFSAKRIKGEFVLFERTRLKKEKKKERNNQGDRTKTALQKVMNKWKCFFQKKKREKNKLRPFKKRVSKHKRVST